MTGGPVTSSRSVRPSVLVADDDGSLRRGIVRALDAAGFAPFEAADGREAVELLAQRAFDAVITDVMMPGMGGIELLRAVREKDLDLPVVLISGAPDVDSAVEAVRYGATDYLIKPVELATLERKVRRVVRLHELAKLKRDALRLLSTGRPEPGDRVGLEVIFDRTLESLWLAYQPIVDASSRSVFGYEALLRSSEPALPHAGAVLDAAERLGRVEDLGRTVRSLAPEPMASVPPSALLFVNVHAHDLGDDTLGEPAAPLSALAPRVVLEITERASLDEVEDVRGTVKQLRSMGFRIAIDDLGAGYAGLTTLAQLEPDFVKLDMSLIRDVDRNPVKQKLVRSMTGLCREMGIGVIAEGIETQSERNTIVELGCDLLQGYFFARPGKPFPEVSW